MLRKIRGIRKTPINLLWYWQKSFNICLCIKRRIHVNHWPRLKKTREEMQTTLEDRKKVAVDSPRNVLKKKNRVEGGVLGSKMSREQESTNLKA
jgi:hypothetical protein